MALRVALAARPEGLVAGLVDLLGTPPADPFAADVVVVPNPGLRDWLTARLATHLGATGPGTGDGVCANVRFLFPGQFLRAALGAIRPEDDPWDPDALAWRVLALLRGGELEAPGFGATPSPYAYARRVADLFDRYAVQRPEMLRAWAGGHDLDGPPGGEAEPVAEGQRWQLGLWRALRRELGPSPAERLVELRAGLRDGTLRPDLPSRVAVFGLAAVSATQVSVLEALAADREVAVLVVHPSPRVAAAAAPVAVLDPPLRPPPRPGAHHPLLAGWGRPAVEAAHLLAALGRREVVPATTGPDTVLAGLQRAVAEDLASLPARSRDRRDELLARGDASVQVHTCHGPVRQVEALRDALLHLFVADPSLRPADVVVVCPDLERVAPLVEPVLGAPVGDQQLPVAVSDRSLTTRTPVAHALDALLELAAGRCGLSELAPVLALDAVRDGLGLQPDDLVRLDRWADALEVRWGLDAEHRARFGYPPGMGLGTWRDALDRLLAGVTVQQAAPAEVAPGLVPWDDLSGDDLDAVGRLAEALKVVGELVESLSSPRPMGEWCDAVGDVVSRCVVVPPDDRWQLDEATEALARLRRESAVAAGVPVAPTELRRLLRGRLGEVSGRTRLRTGAVTVTSALPVRGVPFRVVAVLGLDEDPGAGATDGDDVLGRRPRLGERDPALERREALLDAVLAARDHLLVTCTGRDVATNEVVPPPIVLDELLDAVADAIERGPGHTPARPVVVAHSRQLAAPVNLAAAPGPVRDLVPDRPWTFDRAALAAAQALASGPGPDHRWAPLDPRPAPAVLDLDDLHDTLRRPSRLLLRDRLGLALVRPPEADPEDVDLWLEPLGRSQMGRELLQARRAGEDVGRWLALRPLLGGVPPASLGRAVLDEIASEVDSLLGAAGSAAPVDVVPVDVDLDGVVVRDDLEVAGDTVVAVDFVRYHERVRVRPWLSLAALTLAQPGRRWRARVVCRPKAGSSDPQVVEFGLAGDSPEDWSRAARAVLDLVVDLRARALRAPIPLFERASWTWGRSAAENDLGYDLGDPWTAWAHGDVDVQVLLAQPSTPADDGLPDEPCRAARYAAALGEAWAATTVEVDR